VLARDRVVQDRLVGEHRSTSAGAAAGVTGGAVVGGLTGLLVGLGALAIPGIGPVIAAGTIATALGSAAVGAGVGAVTGGILGALVGLGVPEEEAQVYAEGVKRGGILVAVRTDDTRATEATNIMRQFNVADINTLRNQWKQAGWTGYDDRTVPGENYPVI